MHELLRDFTALFFPRVCLACDNALVSGEDTLCTRCLAELPKTNYHLQQNNPFYLRLRGRVSVKQVMAMFKFVKQTRVQHVMHALKYKNHPEIGVMLGRIYGAELLEAGFNDEYDLIVPVPLHKSRKKRRGFNQSERFGEGLSQTLHTPCLDDIIMRKVKTETQTRKTRLSRWQNVSDVFLVVRPNEVENKRILIVDDVITTGATLEACAQALLNHKAHSVSIACIAAAQ